MINDFINKEVYEELLKIWHDIKAPDLKVKTENGHDCINSFPKNATYIHISMGYIIYLFQNLKKQNVASSVVQEDVF